MVESEEVIGGVQLFVDGMKQMQSKDTMGLYGCFKLCGVLFLSPGMFLLA